MQNPQEVFNKIQTNKAKVKDLKKAFKDDLESVSGYVDICDQIKALKEKKKQIEETTKSAWEKELTQIEDLTIDIKSDQEMLSDILVTAAMKGETVQIVDLKGNEYEPVLKATLSSVK